MLLRRVLATRYVTPLREGGSLPGLVEGDDDGMYVTKFRGAGQGPKALVAEVICGRLAQLLGLPVPEMVLIEIDPALGRSEPDPEINDLITASAGLNFGLDFLPGALDYNPARPGEIDPALASEIVWFDALVTNVDRTPRNPNLLVWHRRIWLIDHGACLYRQHAGGDLAESARAPFPGIRDHVLLPLAGELAQADARLAARLDRQAVEDAVGLVPEGWLGEDPGAARDMYARHLCRRLEAPRVYLDELEALRAA